MTRNARLGREFWQGLIAEMEASELSQVQFAKERGVSPSTLLHWLYRFRKEKRNAADPNPCPRTEATPRMVPVRLAQTATSSPPAGGMEVVVGPCTIRVERHADPASVAALVAALGRPC